MPYIRLDAGTANDATQRARRAVGELKALLRDLDGNDLLRIEDEYERHVLSALTSALEAAQDADDYLSAITAEQAAREETPAQALATGRTTEGGRE